MAKLKPAGSKKQAKKGPASPGAIPCLILLISGFTLLGLLLYYAMKG